MAESDSESSEYLTENESDSKSENNLSENDSNNKFEDNLSKNESKINDNTSVGNISRDDNVDIPLNEDTKDYSEHTSSSKKNKFRR